MAKFILPDNGSLTMSTKAADRLIARHDGTAALAYICILRSGEVSADKLAAQLDISVAEAEHAVYRLAEMGLVDTSENETVTSHEYSAADISAALENYQQALRIIDENNLALNTVRENVVANILHINELMD